MLQIAKQTRRLPEVELARCLARWYKIVGISCKKHAFLWQINIQCYILCIKLLFSVTFCASSAIQCYSLFIKLLFRCNFCASNCYSWPQNSFLTPENSPWKLETLILNSQNPLSKLWSSTLTLHSCGKSLMNAIL